MAMVVVWVVLVTYCIVRKVGGVGWNRPRERPRGCLRSMEVSLVVLCMTGSRGVGRLVWVVSRSMRPRSVIHGPRRSAVRTRRILVQLLVLRSLDGGCRFHVIQTRFGRGHDDRMQRAVTTVCTWAALPVDPGTPSTPVPQSCVVVRLGARPDTAWHWLSLGGRSSNAEGFSVSSRILILRQSCGVS